jgi:prolyl-tRNA synthetase
MLTFVHDELVERARRNLAEKTSEARSYEEFLDAAENKPGFIKAMWCGERACEEQIKEEAGLSSRCMPFEQEELSDVCVCCGRKAKKMVYWGKAY